MSDPGGVLIGRIVIERRLFPDGRDLVTAKADKGDLDLDDDGLEAVVALGMLRLAESLVVPSIVDAPPSDEVDP